MFRRLSTIALPWGLVVLVVLVFYGRAVFLGELFSANDIAGSDTMMQSYPARAEFAQELRDGRLSLWTDNLFLGFPVAAEGQAGVFYPLNLLFFLLLPVSRAYTLLTVLHVILGGLFTALFARSLGRSRSSAALAGTIFSLSGFMVCHLRHTNLVASAAWIPLALWLVERWSRRMKDWRAGFWLGVLAAGMILAGHVQTAYYAGIVILLYLLWVVVGRSREARSAAPVRRGLLLVVLMLLVGVGLSAVQTSLTYEYTSLGTRAAGLTYEEATGYDYRVQDLLMYVDPYRFGDPGRATYFASGEVQSIFWENCGYVGILPLGLALLAGIACRRHRHVKFLLGLTALSVLLVLGRGSPIHAFFFHVVPGFDRFRFPSRFLLYVTFCLAMLSAYGVDWIAERLGQGRTAAAAVKTLALILVVLNLLAFGYTQNPTLPAALWLSEPESVQFLKNDTSRFRIWSPEAIYLHLRAYRQAKGWKGDLTPYLEQRNALQPNLNGLFGVQSLGVYFPAVPMLFLDTATGLDSKPPTLWRFLDMYNVKYLLAGREIPDSHFALRAWVPGGIHIYENLNVLPRAWVVPEAISVSSPERALSVIGSEGFDPRHQVTLQGWRGPPATASAEATSVMEVARRAGRVEYRVTTRGRGYLVVSDAFYPGWEVRVDGEKGEILQANIVCRAVELPPGDHRVAFEYRPSSLVRGLIITLATLAVLGVLLGRHLIQSAIFRVKRAGETPET